MAQNSPFFGLPLELRNSIYGELFRKGPIEAGYWNTDSFREVPNVVLNLYAEPSLLRINKQFKAEYEREVFRTAQLRLHITDLDSEDEFDPASVKSYAFMNIRHVEVAIFLSSISKIKG